MSESFEPTPTVFTRGAYARRICSESSRREGRPAHGLRATSERSGLSKVRTRVDQRSRARGAKCSRRQRRLRSRDAQVVRPPYGRALRGRPGGRHGGGGIPPSRPCQLYGLPALAALPGSFVRLRGARTTFRSTRNGLRALPRRQSLSFAMVTSRSRTSSWTLETLKIEGVVDWEYGGYWPPFFETPYFRDARSSGAEFRDERGNAQLADFLRSPNCDAGASTESGEPARSG
ncbi:hypothetical protein VTK73DRAFT_2072 [Phialemonium thermophilum]|uniref:Uncharacterized protein n=1 Tax=Phialemonium thermophilum TaxID=223376 RepID=A0ABR3VSL9_9PEZI